MRRVWHWALARASQLCIEAGRRTRHAFPSGVRALLWQTPSQPAILSSLELLPSELILRVLSEFDLDELIGISHVCRLLRHLALNDLRFWRDIRIDSISPRSLRLAALQIDTAGSRSFCLTIDYTAEHRLVETEVLKLLARALASVSELRIRINSIFTLALWDVLQLQPAPSLTRLSLHMHLDHPQDIMGMLEIPLPVPIFTGVPAPHLRFLSLKNVFLPMISTPGLSHVAVLHFMFHEDLCMIFPSELFTVFPKVEILRIGAHSSLPCLVDGRMPGAVVEGFSRLKAFEAVFNGSTMSWLFEHLPMERIPDVYISCADFDIVYDALACVLTPLHLRIREYNKTIWLSVYSTRTDHARHFIDPRCMYNDAAALDPNPLLEDQVFANQLSSVMIDASIWSLMRPVLPDYSVLSTLRLVIDRATPSGETFPTESILFPSLETLGLHSRKGNLSVDTDDLIQFVDRIALRLLKLELVNISLAQRDGGPLASSRFVEVIYHPTNLPRLVED